MIRMSLINLSVVLMSVSILTEAIPFSFVDAQGTSCDKDGKGTEKCWSGFDGSSFNTCQCWDGEERCHENGSALDTIQYYQNTPCKVKVEASWSCEEYYYQPERYAYLQLIQHCPTTVECTLEGASEDWEFSADVYNQCDNDECRSFCVRMKMYYYDCNNCYHDDILRANTYWCD